ncbi:Mitochondrial 2-oxoglutarate/malate carrier protein [Porphyridium purpureum]|uniref:Mitochondrial 2-oxoglutarate/malate carrier protein n=1 Tax=Porphyridium purpureum TaxID=35688 RepID=A0A5J4YNN5_PORPP|nr:Mitochondrial 2-oxoglutarate/malate carrier protein [Porphyridium purpureum]|eukprot:POR2720..scf295_9
MGSMGRVHDAGGSVNGDAAHAAMDGAWRPSVRMVMHAMAQNQRRASSSSASLATTSALPSAAPQWVAMSPAEAAQTVQVSAPAPAQKPLSKVVQFSTAGLGGIMGWILCHPFNTVAIRMNLSGGNDSFPTFTRNIVRNEGVLTLYKGLSAGILRQVFYATSRFGLFEVFRDQLAKYRETDLLSRLIVGVASGGAAAFISCPAEVSLVRMSNDASLPLDQRRKYTSVLNAATRIVSEEGVSTFWRGSAPFVMRCMLVGATQVGTYDQFKQTYAGLGVKQGSLSNVFYASMSAGLLYSIITMPFETAKNKMSSQKKDPVSGTLPYRSTFQTISTVARAEGTMALWKGFLPYYGRCGSHTVLMFIFVEQLREAYRSHFME